MINVQFSLVNKCIFVNKITKVIHERTKVKNTI